MSFMPNPGSVVRLDDGRIAIVTKAKAKGPDLVWTGTGEEEIAHIDQIVELIYEPPF